MTSTAIVDAVFAGGKRFRIGNGDGLTD